MKSIQVSKGLASVKNGFESVAGQVNVVLQPAEDVNSLTANVYGDSKSRAEVNFLGNCHLTNRWSSALLTHYENRWGHHDENDDGFMDQPDLHQVNLHNRWAYIGPRYIFHGSLSLLGDRRKSGETGHDGVMAKNRRLWFATVDTDRYQATMKHAFVLGPEQGANIALMASFIMNSRHDVYDVTTYDVNEKNLYVQIMYETNILEDHNLSTGLSFAHDYLGQHLGIRQLQQPSIDLHEDTIPHYFTDPATGAVRQLLREKIKERENVAGAYGVCVLISRKCRIKYLSLYLITERNEKVCIDVGTAALCERRLCQETESSVYYTASDAL